MSEGHLGTAQAAHTLHRSEDAFLYITHMGLPTRLQCPLTNTERKDYISPIMSGNFPGWEGRSRKWHQKENTSLSSKAWCPHYPAMSTSHIKEVTGAKGHHLDVSMNINHLLLRENLFFYISLKVTYGSTVTGSNGPDLPRHRNITFKEWNTKPIPYSAAVLLKISSDSWENKPL